MKLSIITPCFNAAEYIEETIESVISQRGDFEVEHIIIDGNSTDNTVNIASRYKQKIDSLDYPIKCNSVSMHVVSESDTGMYDALAKGLKQATGDIIAYQNADDFYLPNAFSAVVLTFLHHPPIRWLTGIISGYNANGNIYLQKLPYQYNSQYLQQGLYGKELPFIQQESCFWRRSLHRFIDMEKLASFKYAGDFYLWSNFSKENELRILNVPLSGFRRHGENKSSDLDAYWSEFDLCTTEHVKNLDKNRNFLLHKKAWQLSNPEILHINRSIIRLDPARLQQIKGNLQQQQNDNTVTKTPLISVITVCYNDETGLKETLPNVVSQDFSDFEYIVIDGASSDSSKDLLHQYADNIATLVSEKDHGIYDAMNKGVKHAKGEWIIFMNAGDYFSRKNALSHMAEFLSDNDIVYGDRIYQSTDGSKRVDKAKPIETIFTRMPFCHQSTFVRSTLLKKHPFNLTYKYGADYNFFIEQYTMGRTFYQVDYPVCVFVQGGKSESGLRPHIEATKILLDNCPDKSLIKNSAYVKALRQNFNNMFEGYFND